jgi:hypothetical protein
MLEGEFGIKMALFDAASLSENYLKKIVSLVLICSKYQS